ncbi:MAG: hypothetical protein ACXVXO_00690 [Mycobacteriaceae bacterium]
MFELTAHVVARVELMAALTAHPVARVPVVLASVAQVVERVLAPALVRTAHVVA